MDIQSVKRQGNEFLINGEIPVPDENHRYYKDILEWEASGGVIEPEFTDEQLEINIKEQTKFYLEISVQSHLDAEAQKLGYDNIVSACTYASASNPFQAEGKSFVSWRGNVWATCYQILADVEAGIRPVPTEAELLAELPTRI